jgi:predicted kinase
MCGLPRAGKSSWIKKRKKNCVVVSADEIRKEIFGHQFHQQANKFVFAIVETMASLLLKQGLNVIVDATHLTEAVRLPWLEIARLYNTKATIIWVYADKDPEKNLEICLERNKLSIEGEQLPEIALKRMHTMFEEPISGVFEVFEYRNKQISN